MAASTETTDLRLDSDRGRKPAEKQAARLQNAPGAVEHSLELMVIARKVKNRTAQDHVGEVYGKGHRFERLGVEVLGQKWCGEPAYCRNGLWVFIGAIYFIAFPEEVDKITPVAASRVENTHPRHDATSQQLVEQVDVNLPELLRKSGHGYFRSYGTCRYSAMA